MNKEDLNNNNGVAASASTVTRDACLKRNATDYVDLVKREYGHQSSQYTAFSTTLRQARDKTLSPPEVAKRIKDLFHGNINLISGFNELLPLEYRVHLPPQKSPVESSDGPDSPGLTESLAAFVQDVHQSNPKSDHPQFDEDPQLETELEAIEELKGELKGLKEKKQVCVDLRGKGVVLNAKTAKELDDVEWEIIVVQETINNIKLGIKLRSKPEVDGPLDAQGVSARHPVGENKGSSADAGLREMRDDSKSFRLEGDVQPRGEQAKSKARVELLGGDLKPGGGEVSTRTVVNECEQQVTQKTMDGFMAKVPKNVYSEKTLSSIKSLISGMENDNTSDNANKLPATKKTAKSPQQSNGNHNAKIRRKQKISIERVRKRSMEKARVMMELIEEEEKRNVKAEKSSNLSTKASIGKKYQVPAEITVPTNSEIDKDFDNDSIGTDPPSRLTANWDGQDMALHGGKCGVPMHLQPSTREGKQNPFESLAIPSTILASYDNDRTVQLVKDPLEEARQMASSWSDEERCVFFDQYLISPKDFRKIGVYLEKSTSACIGYYYDSTMKVLYNDAVKEYKQWKRSLGEVVHWNKTVTAMLELGAIAKDDSLDKFVLLELELARLSQSFQSLRLAVLERMNSKDLPCLHHIGNRGSRGSRRSKRNSSLSSNASSQASATLRETIRSKRGSSSLSNNASDQISQAAKKRKKPSGGKQKSNKMSNRFVLDEFEDSCGFL